MVAKILIVGAGPVGLTMAAELARYGVPIRIVDRAAQRTTNRSRSCSGAEPWNCSTVRVAAPHLVAAGHEVTGANIIAGAETIGYVDLSCVASPYPFALMLPQSETEKLKSISRSSG